MDYRDQYYNEQNQRHQLFKSKSPGFRAILNKVEYVSSRNNRKHQYKTSAGLIDYKGGQTNFYNDIDAQVYASNQAHKVPSQHVKNIGVNKLYQKKYIHSLNIKNL